MFREILYRHIYIVPLICGLAVQFIKLGLYSLLNKKFDISRFFQTDGMPNLHAVVFTSLSVVVGVKYGYSSIIFAVIATYSAIIMHDTMRLKRAKEKQVDVLNRIILSIKEYGEVGSARISRVLQFRPLDVLGGAALGVLITYLLL
ncbi:MAG: divergent PAP2 family protein [Candidatus Krumholzibacteriota bacterium]|nr:divergent PAP2 family protein [Candidatus Krumholzibacteriota bacterium]